MTVAEAAQALGVSPNRVRQYIGEGKLRAEKLHRQLYLVQRDDVEALKKVPRQIGWPKGKPRKPRDAALEQAANDARRGGGGADARG